MIVNIDFTVFKSPTEAYGNFTGKLRVPDAINVGDEIKLIGDNYSEDVCFKIRVTSKVELNDNPGEVILGLDDVVFNSLSDASDFVNKIESNLGLFFDYY